MAFCAVQVKEDWAVSAVFPFIISYEDGGEPISPSRVRRLIELEWLTVLTTSLTELTQ